MKTKFKQSYPPFQDYDSYYDRRGFDDTRDLYERRFTGMTGMSGNDGSQIPGTIIQPRLMRKRLSSV